MIIALDIGGTKIAAALVDNGQVIEKRKIASVVHTNLVALASTVNELCHDWYNHAQGLAIACTGQVAANKVHFLSAQKSLPLKDQLTDLSGLPVTIINDAAAAALAEYHARSNLVDDSLVYITISTGIGGGIVQNGQLISANDGFCAHLGHVSVPTSSQNAIVCHCGKLNCIEAISSGTAIGQQASKLLGKQVSARQVFCEYGDDPRIKALLQHCAKAMAMLISDVRAITGSKCLVLGGSVGQNPAFFALIKQEMAKLPGIYQLEIQLAKAGANADLLGACLYFNQNSLPTKQTASS